MLSATQQTQEEVERTKQQLSFEIDRIKQESDMKVGALTPSCLKTKKLDKMIIMEQCDAAVCDAVCRLCSWKSKSLKWRN